MVLVDTSVWIDHLRLANTTLVGLLEGGLVLSHPFVVGELALGLLAQRSTVLSALSQLPQAVVAMDDEVLHLINQETIFGRGIGYIDCHLLAAVRLTSGASLWTHDKGLHSVAHSLGVAKAGPPC